MLQKQIISLAEEVAAVLPQGHSFNIYHISSPPTKCDAIYSPPPSTKPDRTFRESHLLQVSIPTGESNSPTFILAIECLIYTTRHLTTIFVSKADSSGYLSLLRLGREHDSPLRTISTTFVAYLVKHRMRPGIPLVVDLFARASDQYLYPGSVENPSKHVSDDRQLVKWWCRVLDPVLQSYAPQPPSESLFEKHNGTKDEAKDQVTAQSFLLVPGEDSIASFLPQPVRLNPTLRARWTHGHPLRSLTRYPFAPPRCLIPHFPDDPKGRYLDELDDELPDASSQTNGAVDTSPSKRGTGEWRSVRSLDQFWEMMGFRSECASGRLVGFLWFVFTPPTRDHNSDSSITSSASQSFPSHPTSQTPLKPSKKSAILRGPVPLLLPRILRSSSLSSVPAETAWYYWPTNSRGTIVLPDSHYSKAMELLLQMDFAGLKTAVQSTRSWIAELSVLANLPTDWGLQVVGTSAPIVRPDPSSTEGEIQSLNVLGVKRKNVGNDVQVTTLEIKKPKMENEIATNVNVLGAGMVRKKPKKVAPLSVS